MTPDYLSESLIHDPIHGYISFVSRWGLEGHSVSGSQSRAQAENSLSGHLASKVTPMQEDEVSEQEIIDHPWVQRMRQIHQLQTAWWVFPSAEHMRFQHVLGAMHLASRCISQWYESLCDACENVPSKAHVESLVRLAALLHDVGHGPFGHFFDDHYLDQYDLTHEDLGSHIIEHELGDLIRGVRRNPNGVMKTLEVLDPKQVGWLIRRPKSQSETDGHPDWLQKLRALFSGIYTVDNMDFVLRDAYMSGYNTKAFDISRLLHYSFFTPQGLTIHSRGLPTLINFIETRANLFRSIYFHRTVRALDIALEELFPETMKHLFPGNPLDHLDEYMQLTEVSFLVDISRWSKSQVPEIQALGRRWDAILRREVTWKMACERTINFHNADSMRMTIYSEPDLLLKRVRERLPKELRAISLRCDVAQHYHRPSAKLPVKGQNYLLDPAMGDAIELSDDELFRQLPTSFLIFRIYAKDHGHEKILNEALNSILGGAMDAKTNM
ncbi:MAG: HD domain-containing protein [Planctomycetaceae bacterium]|nr:HD domain-containing protein [Planctomycetaceae bacterium]